MDDEQIIAANLDALYYTKLVIGKFWHRARKARGCVHVSGFVFPEEGNEDWDDAFGVVPMMEACEGDPEANFVWIDAERGLRTVSEVYWLGHWDASFIQERNVNDVPYVVCTNDVRTLFERFKDMNGIQDTVMPYSCLGGIAGPQEAMNLFAGDQLHTMPYRNYLKTDHWQEMRAVALEIAGNRCQLCNGESRLQTHHRTYLRRGFEYPSDLIVLCGNCHAKFHDKLSGGDR